MELWIRSQDRTVLTKIYDVRIDLHYDDKWKIQANLDRQGDYYLIGIYNSKERALEVLDEIHNHLEKLFWFNPQAEDDRRLNQLIKTYVYKMPKE